MALLSWTSWGGRGPIFISYRRAASGWAASKICADLARAFGKVFIDLDSIPVGVDFVQHLHREVDRCRVFVLLIAESWDTSRLFDRRDFVRIEIERALDRGKMIVPVLLDNAQMPSESDVPYVIQDALSRQAVRVRRESYQVDLPHLIETLRSASTNAGRGTHARFWPPHWLSRNNARVMEAVFAERVRKDVLEELLRGGEQLLSRATGTRVLTVMFSDTPGFTSIAEQLAAPDLIAYFADLMTPFTDAIIRRRGTVDKYIGDSILAFWNAPLDDRTPEANACAAALDLQAAATRLNREFAARGQPTIRLGVGLATGRCTVGPIGSRRRFEYSCLGDTVNLASRLTGLLKFYQVPRLIDERTARAVENQFALLEVDTVRIKGKARPMRLFALIGENSLRADSGFQAFCEAYTVGRAAYLARDWKSAEAAFTTAARMPIHGFDGASLCEGALQRVGFLRDHPPPEDWEGVFALPPV